MKLKDSQIIFGSLADPTRFRILSLLSEGELCVCDVMRVLKEPQSKISRHLAYLRRAGLVEARKEGLWMHYRLAKPNTKVFRSIFGALNCCRSDFKELKKDLNEFHKNKNRLVSCCPPKADSSSGG
ncbi:MAG: metalloregulator ArsR/SmtB family transcription factor [Candidatus Omnitrophica bacterium]|nr:metalloregulator ArsR/SmtB family transcription factor [Candidatus Omnitrophota bacterium]